MKKLLTIRQVQNIIGKDEVCDGSYETMYNKRTGQCDCGVDERNELRAELRAKLKTLSGLQPKRV